MTSRKRMRPVVPRAARGGDGMAAAGSWATFAALLLAASVSPFDYSILNVALPTIARDTRATSADLEWMVVSYAIAYVAVMLIGASAGDRLGRRRVLNLGLLAFGLASVGAYMASTPTQIIAARSAMGLGSSLIVPMSLSLIQTSGTAAQRAGAIRIWGAMAGLSLALGPVAGGALISGSGWRAIFALDATAAAAALLLSLMFVTESRSAEPGSVDWLGSALSVVALLCLLW